MDSWSVDSNAGSPLMMEGAYSDPATMAKKRRSGFGGFLDSLGNQQQGQRPSIAGAIGQAAGASTMGGLAGRAMRFFL